MEGSAGGSLLSVACEGMEGVDGGLGSRVGGCGGMGMEDFSRLDVHAEMWIGWCKFQIFLGAFGALWRDGEGGLVGFSVVRCRFGMSMIVGMVLFRLPDVGAGCRCTV